MERVWHSLFGEEDDGEDNREEDVVQEDIDEGRQDGRQEREDANIELTPPASQAEYKVPCTTYWVQTCAMLILLLCVFTVILSGNREFRPPCG